MVLCDTNILIHAFNGRQATIDRLQEIGFYEIALSVISVMELYQGMSNKTELAQMKRKIKYYDVIEIDTETSKLAAKLIETFKLSNGLQIPDAIIGATAVVHQLPFFTYNTKDFDFIPGIIFHLIPLLACVPAFGRCFHHTTLFYLILHKERYGLVR